MHNMNVQEVGTAEDANSNPLATAATSSGTGCLVCQQKASVFYRRPTARSDDDVCTCSTRVFSNHLTQTGTLGVALAGERGGAAQSSCCSSSSNDNDDNDFVLPTSDALHHKLDQLYAPSSSVRTSGGRRRRRGGGTKKKTVDIYLNDDDNKGDGSSNSKSSSDDSLSMKKPAAIPLGSVKLAPKYSGGSSMGSETAFSASSAQHLLGFHLKLRQPFRAQSLSPPAMKASTTASTAAASKSDASWTASASAPAVVHRPRAREGPLARSASLQPKSSYSTSGSQMEYYRPEQLQRQDELQDWLNTHPQPCHHSASASAAQSSDCVVMPPYQQLQQLLSGLPQKEELVTEALLGVEKDTYPSAIVHPKPSAPYSKCLAGAIEAVSVAASPPSLPTKSVSLQVLSPISSSKVARNPYLHLVLDELHIEDDKSRQGYPGHHHPPSSLSQPQPQPLHPWQSEQPSPTTALSKPPLVMHHPRSIYTTTLGATFPPSFAVTMNSSNHHHHHQPSCISESFHSESKRRREQIWHEYLRLIESRSYRDPGRTISSSCSESGTSSSGGGRLFFLEDYPSQEHGYSNKTKKKKNEKSSSKSSSSKADGSDTSSATTTGGNREGFILDKMEQLEWMYDLDQVHGDDDYLDEARPEL
jgi:hypothetical protein